MKKIAAFAMLFWANRGNHNEMTAQKFLPDFTFDELQRPRAGACKNGASGPLMQICRRLRLTPLDKELDDLRPSLFDPNFEPMITAKSPRGGKDILQASANNFYQGVTLADLKGFHEKYPLNSRW